MTSLPPTHRLVLLDEHESFWIDCIRVVCPDGVPAPTLARAQALRRLFTMPVSHQKHEEVREDLP